MSDTLRDSLYKLFWTMANVALAAGAVEVAGWDQGVATFVVTGLIQLASTFVRGKVDATATEAKAARSQEWGRSAVIVPVAILAAAAAALLALGVLASLGADAAPAAPAGIHAADAATAPDAPAHSSGQCFDIGRWWEAYYFGADPNGVAMTANVPVAWWGNEQCWLRYSNGSGTIVLLYDTYTGHRAWLDLNWSNVESAPGQSHRHPW